MAANSSHRIIAMPKDIRTAMKSNRWFARTQQLYQILLLLVIFPITTLTAQTPADSSMVQASEDTTGTDLPVAAANPDAPEAVLASMSNPRNPLLQINTNVGNLWVELFPQAAPDNVDHLMDLLSDEQWHPRLYENTTFHRVERNLYIQTGALDEAEADRDQLPRVNDEINGIGLGLEQLPTLETNGQPHSWLNISDANDFRQRLLRPLYAQLGINNREELASQQRQVLDRLNDMNLLQAHELMGYEYNARLPSRRPLAGSVVMVNRGPNTNQSEFAILLADMPWLTGTHTVIGQMVGGSTPATLISQRRPGDIRVISIELAAAGQTGRTGSAASSPSAGGLP